MKTRVSLKCFVHDCRPILVNTNFNETLFYQFTVDVNKCGESCNTNYDPYAQVCVPDKVKNMNVKVLTLVLGINKKTFLIQHECVRVNAD